MNTEDEQEHVVQHLMFDGVLIASVSTETAFKERWTEVFLYRTSGGNFVSDVVGVSIAAGEEDFHTVNHTCDALVLISRLEHRGRLTVPCRAAVEQAGEVDDDIRSAFALYNKPTFID